METVCICKGTLDSRIMLVAKLPQMRKTMVFDASGNQTHETRTNAIQGQLILTRISWQALCKTDFKMDLPDRAKCAGQCTNVSPHRAIIFSTGPEPTHCCTEPAFCDATHCLHNAILFLHMGLAYGCTNPFIIWVGCTRQACAAIRLHRACNYTA